MNIQNAHYDFDASSTTTASTTTSSSDTQAPTSSLPCILTLLPVKSATGLDVAAAESPTLTSEFVAVSNRKSRQVNRTLAVKRKLEMSQNVDKRPRRHCSSEGRRVSKETQLAIKASIDTFQKESYTRELRLKANYTTPVKRRRYLYTAGSFKQLWKHVETELGATTEEIENGSLVREANNDDRTGTKSKSRRTLSSNQTRAQYGRILFSGMQQIMNITNLTRNDIFVDIGHGIGNAVIQASFTVGCEARGIEVVPERCRVAEQFKEIMIEYSQNDLNIKERMSRKVGNIELREGSLTDPRHEKFITEATVLLVNNANEIFGTRSGGSVHHHSLDDHVGALFAKTKPGTRMITLDPILSLGCDLAEENQRRRNKGQDENFDVSFFTCEKLSMGEDAVNWSYKEITVWLYTRVKQSTGDGSAVFLCGNVKCPWRGNPSAAVREDGFLREECVYCGMERQMSTRRS